jgi:hypothetical protein
MFAAPPAFVILIHMPHVHLIEISSSAHADVSGIILAFTVFEATSGLFDESLALPT